MIGKVIIGKSFKGCISYCLNDKLQVTGKEDEQVMQGRAETLLFNKCQGTAKKLTQQFQEVRLLNTKVSKPVLHITLSLAQGEKLHKDQLMEICESCAKEMGFEKNQYIAVHHLDTSHQHLHIVANRIGFDGKTWNDSNNYKRIADFCRKMEKQYGLQQVLSPKKFLSKERQQLPRFDSRKQAMKIAIGQAILKSTNLDQFTSQVDAKGLQVTKSRGISFSDSKGVNVKGSDIGYSLASIEKLLKSPFEAKAIMVEKKNRQQPSDGANSSKSDSQSNSRQQSFTKEPQLPQNKTHTSNDIASLLLDPVNDKNTTPYELLKKKRKRKGMSQ